MAVSTVKSSLHRIECSRSTYHMHSMTDGLFVNAVCSVWVQVISGSNLKSVDESAADEGDEKDNVGQYNLRSFETRGL